MIKKHYLRSCAILLIAMLVAFASCSHKHQYPVVLTTIDSLCESRPDSAQALLKSIETNTANMAEDARMYYKLLTIRCADKLQSFDPSDSLAVHIARYYEKEGDPNLLPMAYYYAGRTYYELNDYPQALQFFHKTLESPEIDNNLRIKRVAYSQIGNIMLYADYFDEALENYRQSYHCAIQMNDSLNMVFPLRNIGNIFRFTLELDSALVYYQKALHIAEQCRNSNRIAGLCVQMAAVLSEKKEYENANNWLTKAKNESPNAEDMSFYCIAAHNYKLLGNTDSALFYCNKLVNEESYHARHDAYSEFVDIYNARKEYDKAYLYALKFKQQNDSIEALMAQENVAKMQAIYKFQHIENENNALKIQHQRDLSKTILLSIISIIAVLCACSVFRSWRKNIKDNNEKIKVFEQTIALLEIKKEEIQEQRDKEKEMLESQLSSVMSERQSHTPSIRETDVFLLIQNYVNHNKGLKNEHWNTLSTEINKLYPNFESILLGKYGISETEYRVCLLIKAGFSPKEMGILTNSSIKTISSIRKRLLKKTFNVNETPSQWDKFIKSL